MIGSFTHSMLHVYSYKDKILNSLLGISLLYLIYKKHRNKSKKLAILKLNRENNSLSVKHQLNIIFNWVNINSKL